MILKFNTTQENETVKFVLNVVTSAGVLFNADDLLPLPPGTNECSLTLTKAGENLVYIAGNIDQFKNNSTPEFKDKLTEVVSFGNLGLKYLDEAFKDADNLIKVAPIPPSVVSLNNCFEEIDQVEIEGLSNWKTKNVTSMSGIFKNAKNFNQNINTDEEKWDVSNVTDLSFAFEGATKFNQDLSGWDTGNVTTLEGTFKGATDFNQDVNDWNIENVSTLENTFEGATNFDQNLEEWNIKNVDNMDKIFNNTSLSSENYNKTLIGWSKLPETKSDVKIDAIDIYAGSDSKEAREKLKEKGWVFNDLGIYVSFKYKITEPNQTIKFYLYGVPDSESILKWGDNQEKTLNQGDNICVHTYENIGEYEVVISTTITKFKNESDPYFKGQLIEVSSIGDNKLINLNNAFNGANYLTKICQLTPSVVSLDSCFINITQDSIIGLSEWNTENIGSMVAIFKNAKNFDQNISKWNTTNVESMNHMFYNAKSFNQDIGDWNIVNTIDFGNMLDSCGLSLDNYDSLLIGWSKQTINPNIVLDANGLNHSVVSLNAKELLTNPQNNWTINDSGMYDYFPEIVDEITESIYCGK